MLTIQNSYCHACCRTGCFDTGSAINKQKSSITLISILFFLFGFVVALNDILTPYLKKLFVLSYTETMLIQFTFFGCYFIISHPATRLIALFGYKKSFITGVLLIASGCFSFILASELALYAVFLCSFFILASGITILQVSANPYLLKAGDSEKAASRLIFAQGLNSLGTTIAPFIGSALILAAGSAQAVTIKILYCIVGLVLVLYALLLSRFQFSGMVPPVKPGDDKVSTQNDKVTTQNTGLEKNFNLFKNNRRLLLGSFGIFVYVGAEVAIGSLMINFISDKTIGNLSSLQSAGYYLPYYWGGAMIGRFAGSYLTRKTHPARLLFIHAVVAAFLVSLTLVSQGHLAMVSILAVGLFNSIMFPTIFLLSLEGLGRNADKGSGILCMAIVGGAIVPLIQGYIADHIGLHLSYFIPLLCYIYIALFAFYAKKTLTQNGDLHVK